MVYSIIYKIIMRYWQVKSVNIFQKTIITMILKQIITILMQFHPSCIMLDSISFAISLLIKVEHFIFFTTKPSQKKLFSKHLNSYWIKLDKIIDITFHTLFYTITNPEQISNCSKHHIPNVDYIRSWDHELPPINKNFLQDLNTCLT